VNVRRIAIAAALLFCALGFARGDEEPLADAKVGEWTLMKQKISWPGGSAVSFVYAYVSKVDGRKVSVVTQTLNEDGKTGLMAGVTTVRDLDKKPEPGDAKATKATVSYEDLDVNGKKIKCKKTETEVLTNGVTATTTTWVSNDVPVHGLVRLVVKDKDGKEQIATEIVDFGSTGGAEKPLK
jgi:hypothetical protein